MLPSPGQPPVDLPVLVFDGECDFCRAAVDRWRDAIGQQVRFAPYQEVASRFPQIDPSAFRRAIHYVDSHGAASRGAVAIFRAMAHAGRKRWLLWLYTHLPPLAWFAELVYRSVAANRKPLSLLRRIWWGKDLQRPSYHIATALFLRLLGLVYLIAFLSLWVQIDGLIGEHGILPAKNYLNAIQQLFAQQTPPQSAMWNLPTLVWLSPTDGFLHALCGAGTVMSLLLIAGVLPLPTLILLWVDYLSLLHVGQDFLSFQWDILLLETGFAAIFLAPFVWRSRFLTDRHPPRLALWLLWWLLFRLMLESGAVKLTWSELAHQPDGSPTPNTWRLLTALNFHYWTQPLPMWISWYAAKLPEWFQKLSVLFVLIVELGSPWLMFGPRVLRYIACGAVTLLVLLIAATGNYNFFNLLTIFLALTLLDDKAWPQFLRRRIRGTDWPVLAFPTRWRSFLLVPVAGLFLLIGFGQVGQSLAPTSDAGFSLAEKLNPTQFCLVNSYGLFRQMTETRPEILIEGSVDGGTWKPYEFRWKPGELSQAPRCNTPHQPRLDWQMWFEALNLEWVYNRAGTIDVRGMDRWFQAFIFRLLEGEPAVLELLAGNPFPDAPPRFVRITLCQYCFTDADQRRQTGDWWQRKIVWVGPAMSLNR